jgi:hypothetical protein
LDQRISIPVASDQPKGLIRRTCHGDYPMRIARDGTWYYRGTPIHRKPLVKLFSSVLKRDPAGTFWLETPAERGRIQVDDAPFTAVELSREGEGEEQLLRFRTNLDEWVTAGADHPIRIAEDPETGEPSPYLLVRNGLEALIVRSVYYELVDLAVEQRLAGGSEFGLWSNGSFFSLGASS